MKIKTSTGIFEYNADKIKADIIKAFNASNNEVQDIILNDLEAQVKMRLVNQAAVSDTIDKDIVLSEIGKVLMANRMFEVADAFTNYRIQHTLNRDLKGPSSIYKMFEKYFDRTDININENANMDFSLMSLNNNLVRALTEMYWLDKIYPKNVGDAHKDGYIHIHDLDQLAAYCCGWDIPDVLLKGFGGVSGKIHCGPPKHFPSALGQIVNFFYTLQGETAGAQAFSNFDTYLAPFIAYDGLTYKQVKQAIQEFVFNMNVPTRSGGQAPFTNITLDLIVPNHMKSQPTICGGEYQKDTFGAFQKEMNMFNKALFEVMSEGDAQGRIFTFPIPTVNIGPDFEWDNKNIEGLWDITAKYGIPYFANYINSDMKPEDSRSMCPLDKDEIIVHKSTRGRGIECSSIKSLYKTYAGRDIEVLSAGKYVPARVTKYNKKQMFKITLANGHTITTSDDHANLVMCGKDSDEQKTIPTRDVQKGMYLPYSLNVLVGAGGTYELGYLVGCYAGDGSYSKDSSMILSLHKDRKFEVAEKISEITQRLFGANVVSSTAKNLTTLRINSKAVVGLCKDYVVGTGREKYYLPAILDTSVEFRRGLLDGHYATDGGNRGRIYTSSPKMVKMLNLLAATLGTTTTIYKDDRLGTEPNYTVLIYKLNRGNYGDTWFRYGDKLWVRVDNIENLNRTNEAYCLEVGTDDHLFTVGGTGILTHNCRLRLSLKELHKRGGGLFGASGLTGSVGVVTLNLPLIAYEANGSADRFYTQILKYMDIAKTSLEVKRKLVESLTDLGLYPYTKVYLENIKKRDSKYWSNHFSTVGVIGMYEASQMLGVEYASEEGKKLTERLLKIMNDRLMEFQEETGNFYNLEATPAEGASYKLATKALKKYSKITTSGTDTPYFTNSTMLPAGYSDDLFKVLEHQDSIQTQYTGGTVLHVYLGEKLSGSEAKLLVKRILSQYRLPYISITPTFSICPRHGYISGEHAKCPRCAAELTRLTNRLKSLKGETL